ncbi:DNA-directed DNA polymerase [Spirochaetia bacterium]|nr:DNA-directed DNA polymerase [Spirochaetia bacterium]
MTPFAHLHVHSDFSLQDAAVSVTSLANRAEELGMKYLALTDHGNMFGAMDFIAACGKSVKPIIGCEVYVSPGSRLEKKGNEKDNKYYHLVLLASSREGYFNLVKLCSLAYTEGFYYRPRVDDEALKKYHGGLIALSACVSGEIPRLIQNGKIDEAETKARFYRDIFGDDNFYLEIQDHGIPADVLKGSLSQRDINKAIAEISRKTGIPLVATNDVHYLNRDDSAAHDILLCIGTGKTRAEEKRKRYYGDQFYFKTGDEMAALFPDYPEAITNTIRIAERCNADVPKINVTELSKYLPDFPIPADFKNADEYLRHLTAEGLAKRYAKEQAAGSGQWNEIQKRAEYELDVIISMGFTGYFLIVADFINWAKEHNIPVGPGRGSGAGSIVAYSLRITDIDPLKYGLLFERFLNPERISMPDFDVDFANEGREDVINYVTEKYGRDHVGQIITFGTLAAKAVIKDVARALEIGIPESEMITKLIDTGSTLKKAFETEPKLRELEQNPKYTELFALARKLEGLNRHSSIHAAGVVIGKSALDEFVPLYQERDDPKTGKPGGIATQYTMNFLERCGLVKMDFLGLKTLDVIKHTEEIIRSHGGEYAGFSIENVPEDDEAAFKMLGEGKSFEVFQFESEGMQGILKQAKPNSIEELTALNSLYRPGPMDNIPQFIESKWDPKKIKYPDPSLEDVLKETHGVITYQEQVMQVARIIAGFTLGHADKLRRAMGKKDMEKMVQEKVEFIAGAVKRGHSEKKADEIFELLKPFAGYGFNKSHAAAYSVVAYHTAYLKANFPAEFMAANMTNEIRSADKDKLSRCIDEARKMGLSIDPPDINRSDKLFTVVDGRVVYGFLGIKGLGGPSADEIIECRKDGPYKGFMDFLDRVDIKVVGKKNIEILIQTGAFDCFDITRETLAGNFEKAVEYAMSKQNDQESGQSSLFEDAGEKEYQNFVFEPFPEMGRMEKLQQEKQLIGFYFSGHPMDVYKEIWKKTVKVNLGQPETISPGNYTLLGMIKTLKPHTTSKGGKMAFSSLEDYNGEIETTFFPRTWELCQDKIKVDGIAALRGKIDYDKEKDRYGFIVEDCMDPADMEALAEQEDLLSKQLDEYRAVWVNEVNLNLSRPEDADLKQEYTLVGLLKDLKPYHSQKGNDMAYASLSDYRGEIGVTLFPKIWNGVKDKLEDNTVVVFKGKIKKDSYKNRLAFYPDSMPSLKRLKSKYAKDADIDDSKIKAMMETMTNQNKSAETFRELHIRLQQNAAETEARLSPLRDCLVDNPGPCTVFIHVPVSEGEKVVCTATALSAAADTPQVEALGRCDAVAEVWRV